MKRRLTAVLAVCLALPACAENAPTPGAQPTATATAPGTMTPPATASATTSPTTSPSATPTGSTRVPVYYLGEATYQRRAVLFREFRSVPATSGVVRAAVDAMLHLRPLDADYFSLWPTAAKVNGVRIDGTVATVDLTESARGVRASQREEQTSVQQLVHTVTAAAPAIRSVRLTFDGATKPTLWGRVDVSRALTRAAQIDTLASVWVTEPASGARVSRRFTVKGTASVFEATVSWVVTRPGSTAPIAQGYVTATEGGPGRGTFTVTVSLPAGTSGDVVFKAYESSPEDGSETDPDTKTYRVG